MLRLQRHSVVHRKEFWGKRKQHRSPLKRDKKSSSVFSRITHCMWKNLPMSHQSLKGSDTSIRCRYFAQYFVDKGIFKIFRIAMINVRAKNVHYCSPIYFENILIISMTSIVIESGLSGRQCSLYCIIITKVIQNYNYAVDQKRRPISIIHELFRIQTINCIMAKIFTKYRDSNLWIFCLFRVVKVTSMLQNKNDLVL